MIKIIIIIYLLGYILSCYIMYKTGVMEVSCIDFSPSGFLFSMLFLWWLFSFLDVAFFLGNIIDDFL